MTYVMLFYFQAHGHGKKRIKTNACDFNVCF